MVISDNEYETLKRLYDKADNECNIKQTVEAIAYAEDLWNDDRLSKRQIYLIALYLLIK